MLKYTIKRILAMIPQLFILSILVFLLTKAMPGDPLSQAFRANPNLDPAVLAELQEKAGFNIPGMSSTPTGSKDYCKEI